MDTVIAAVDNSAAARPVLAAAALVAELMAARVEVVHVSEDGDSTARAVTAAAGLGLTELTGPVPEALVGVAKREDVTALVVGARGTPAGRRPGGHVALEVATASAKPVVVVPPQVTPRLRLERALVPLDGTQATAAALAETIRLACGCAIEVIVLHVHDPSTLPPFSDQPHHESAAWEAEFLARNCPRRAGLRIEVRVGAAGEHVLAVADEVDADLVVLGWAQDLSPGRAEVVREVLSRSRVPVLLVPVSLPGGR